MDRSDFEQFHQANPTIYEELVRLARAAKQKGRLKFGIKRLVEHIRWSSWLETGEEYKINNNYAPYYARLIMDRESDLAGLFELRRAKADLERGPDDGEESSSEDDEDLDYWLSLWSK